MSRLGPFLYTNIDCCIVLTGKFSSVLSALDRHREAVSKGVRYRNRCPRCEATSGFAPHELRRRRVRVIVDLAVQVFAIVIIDRNQMTETRQPTCLGKLRASAYAVIAGEMTAAD